MPGAATGAAMSPKPYLRPVSRDGVASEAEMELDYERSLERRRTEHGPASASIDAFWFLVRQGDPARLEAWLERHSADEVAYLRALLLEKCQLNLPKSSSTGC
jgi:hypothetical protein